MKLKIVNLKKFVRTVLIVIGIFISLVIIGWNGAYSKTETSYKEAYIIKGDTLWSIAKEQMNENPYYEEKDIRDMIQEMKQINHL